MMKFKASVVDKRTKESLIIEISANCKTDAVKNIRSNGYKVNTDMVKESELFDYIMQYTDAQPWDWKINKIPN